MINEKLHVLFHDLTGPVGSINTLSQICAAYITKFDPHTLKGKFEKEITSTFKNILSYPNIIIEKLNPAIDALIEINEKDIALSLKRDVVLEVERIKKREEKARLLFKRLAESDTKENLTAFAEEVAGFKQECGVLATIIQSCKDKLVAVGKY